MNKRNQNTLDMIYLIITSIYTRKLTYNSNNIKILKKVIMSINILIIGYCMYIGRRNFIKVYHIKI